MDYIRVLLVGDEPRLLDLIAAGIAAERGVVVTQIARGNDDALRRLEGLRPDVVVVSFERDVGQNLRTLTSIRTAAPTLPVLLFSVLPPSSASDIAPLASTLELLNQRPSQTNMVGQWQEGPLDLARNKVRSDLVPKIRAFCSPRLRPSGKAVTVGRDSSQAIRRALLHPVELVVIAVSTGGPEALLYLLSKLPRNFPVPIAIVQHMPAHFMRAFAGQLATDCPLRIKQARGGECPRGGEVWLSPSDRHLEIRPTAEDFTLQLSNGPRENSCRPSADVLFRTAADTLGNKVLAVVLTGMGTDGLTGCAAVRSVGGQVLVQDRDTSVVWGMPGAVAGAGLANGVHKLIDLPEQIVARVTASKMKTSDSTLRTTSIQPAQPGPTS
ncbi:MAG TPA: chemotaxis response regulator protein-glutamate methylesterase [Deltaproteobacteria bacterium]|nr:chemotaxis response regulator protein-glutamate methylesterase [Deltaproteobacteria bacterium]HCP46073.1 chemotaxis response regulator protein-glutamate methylesterase [Deltaproteobacteria bacterium]